MVGRLGVAACLACVLSDDVAVWIGFYTLLLFFTRPSDLLALRKRQASSVWALYIEIKETGVSLGRRIL